MITRRQTLLLAAGAPLLANPARAATPLAFAAQQFENARAEGGPVVVHVNATWCPTCKAQLPILRKLLEYKQFNNFMAFEIDYDTEKDAMRKLSAPDRSTIIVFRGGKEVGRSVGDTSEEGVSQLLSKAF